MVVSLYSNPLVRSTRALFQRRRKTQTLNHCFDMPQWIAEEQGSQKARHKYKDPNHSLGNYEEST